MLSNKQRQANGISALRWRQGRNLRKHTALTNHAPGLVRVAVHTEAVEETAEAAPLPDQTDLLLASFPRSVTTRMSTGYVPHEPGSQPRL